MGAGGERGGSAAGDLCAEGLERGYQVPEE